MYMKGLPFVSKLLNEEFRPRSGASPKGEFAYQNKTKQLESSQSIYMLFAGWEVRMVKNCDRGLENAARGHRLRAAFSGPRSQFFTIRTDPKPANNMFIFISSI